MSAFEEARRRSSRIGLASIPSHNVHGNWEDIRINHLEHQGGHKFRPWLAWNEPDPETLLVPAYLTAEVLGRFVERQSYRGDFAGAVQELLLDIQHACLLVLRQLDRFAHGETEAGAGTRRSKG